MSLAVANPAAAAATPDQKMDSALKALIACTCSNSAGLFDPLTAREVRRATDAVRAHESTSDELRFISVALWETQKPDALRKFVGASSSTTRRNHPGTLAPCQACLGRWPEEGQHRSARLVTWDKAYNRTTIWRVLCGSATSGKDKDSRIVSATAVPSVQPSVDGFEYEKCEQIVKAYEPFQEALTLRGLSIEDVYADAWCPGHFGPEDDPSRRILWPAIFVRQKGDDNQYSRPVEGIDMRVDMQLEKVVSFRDLKNQIIPARDPLSNYTHPSMHRKDLRPVHITQPEGPSFRVDGWRVNWQRWQFRVGFTPREGAVLHCVSYQDPLRGNEVRPVAYRLSFAEMVVPYGDPKHPHYMKNAFDAGEDGLGKNAHSLVRGCDCLGEIYYFDVNMGDYFGGSDTIEKAICLHEEDFGMLWKHVDWRTGHTEVRRKRRLVVSFICTVANYDYGFYYYLYQDGTMQFEVKLTGILSTGALAPGEACKYGTRLTKDLYAPVHQHFFVARMDMCIDGLRNTVVEVDSFTETKGDHNPHGNAFYAQERVLGTELAAVRDANAATARTWKVKSTTKTNRGGAATAFKLIPAGQVKPMAQSDSPYLKRAGFIKHALWVTPYNADEMFPGGNFPNQHPTGDGLERWTLKDRPIAEADVVMWHVFGVHHVPRLEDYPIMPVEYCSFSMVPFGFFDLSPALDVAPERTCARDGQSQAAMGGGSGAGTVGGGSGHIQSVSVAGGQNASGSGGSSGGKGAVEGMQAAARETAELVARL